MTAPPPGYAAASRSSGRRHCPAVAEITAADTVPLDETTLREIFGNGDDEPK